MPARTDPTPRPRRARTTRRPDPVALQEAWAPGSATPQQDAWTPRPWVPVAERFAEGPEGQEAGATAQPRRAGAPHRPRSGRDHPGPGGRSPAGAPAAAPRPDGRLAFAFYRGAPAVMAFDLSTTPRSDIIVQASGDAHLSNFGLFASPERTLVFDSNDFDETIPGPWEWDVKRLAVSVLIAARTNGFSRAAKARRPCMATVRAYREQMARYRRDAPARHLVRPDDRRDIERGAGDERPHDEGSERQGGAPAARARSSRRPARKDQLKAMGSLTEVVDGQWRIARRPADRDPRRDPRRSRTRSRRRSATTGRRWPRTAESSSSAIASSTSP